MSQHRFLISGGGTGGHIFPAISIANALRERFPDCEILFIGAEGRMEMERVPAAGYNIVGLPVRGFYRKYIWKNIGVIIDLLRSMKMARKIIADFKPEVAIGVGGYASGAALKVAAKMHIPILLQEQNGFAGVTNKLLAKKADKICVAYHGMEKFFPAERVVLTGNPVRQTLANGSKQEAYKEFNFSPKRKTLLIIGGSLGAKTINESILNSLNKLAEHEDIQVLWQTGKGYIDEMREKAKPFSSERLIVTDFIGRMDLAYAMADIVISRAGASSISELCLLAKPAILVPSPNVAEDHQTHNAMALVERMAAIMIKDIEAQNKLVPAALELIYDDKRLKQLSYNINRLAQRDSAKRIADEVVKLLPIC